MNSNMIPKIARRLETFWANFAAERSARSVKSEMSLEIVGSREFLGVNLAADCTLGFVPLFFVTP